MEGLQFNDEKPVYDTGREVIQEQPRSASEIMSNNPPFSSNQSHEEQKDSTSLFTNPLGFFYNKTVAAFDKGSEIIGAVGSTV